MTSPPTSDFLTKPVLPAFTRVSILLGHRLDSQQGRELFHGECSKVLGTGSHICCVALVPADQRARMRGASGPAGKDERWRGVIGFAEPEKKQRPHPAGPEHTLAPLA